MTWLNDNPYLRERDELLAHLVDDGSISAAALDPCCANCGASAVAMQCDSCREWQCADCWRYGRHDARLCPSCAAANS